MASSPTARFSKDFTFGPTKRSSMMSVFSMKAPSLRAPSIKGVPAPGSEPPPPPPPPKNARPERCHHSTLLLLEEYNLPQAPANYWAHKTVIETPSMRGGRRVGTFYPDSPAQQMWEQEQRHFKRRRQDIDRRSKEPGWYEGPAQRLAEAQEDYDDVRNGLRDAAGWHNALQDVRDQRLAAAEGHQKGWFGGSAPAVESEEEMKLRMIVESAVKGVTAMAWTTKRPELTINTTSATPPKTPEKVVEEKPLARNSSDNRSSLFSNFTAKSTRSSIFSIPQSDVTTPPSSGYPSPVLSSTPEEEFWKETGIVPVELPSAAFK